MYVLGMYGHYVQLIRIYYTSLGHVVRVVFVVLPPPLQACFQLFLLVLCLPEL
jgi:hypothetical protein